MHKASWAWVAVVALTGCPQPTTAPPTVEPEPEPEPPAIVACPADVGAQAFPLCRIEKVALDLGLPGEDARPVPRKIGERVQVRGHVARASGIGVVSPRPAALRALLQQDDVAKTGPAKFPGGT